MREEVRGAGRIIPGRHSENLLDLHRRHPDLYLAVCLGGRTSVSGGTEPAHEGDADPDKHRNGEEPPNVIASPTDRLGAHLNLASWCVPRLAQSECHYPN